MDHKGFYMMLTQLFYLLALALIFMLGKNVPVGSWKLSHMILPVVSSCKDQYTKQVRQSPKAPKHKKAPNFNQSKILSSKILDDEIMSIVTQIKINKNQNMLTQLL